MRPGRRGPRTKAPGRARLAVPKPRAAPLLSRPRAAEGTLWSQGCSSPSSPLAEPPGVPFLRDPSQISTVPLKEKGGRGGEDCLPRRRADLVPEPLPDGSRTAGPGRRPAEGSPQRPCGGRRRAAAAGAPPCWCSPRSLARSLARSAILLWLAGAAAASPRPGPAPAPAPRPRPRRRPRPPPVVPPPQLLDRRWAPALGWLRSECAPSADGRGMERGGRQRRDEDNANARGAVWRAARAPGPPRAHGERTFS